jgi:hypothetical protein
MATIALPVGGLKLETRGAAILDAEAGAAISAGQWVYSNATDQVSPADAATNYEVVGIAILAADVGEAAQYVSADFIKLEGFAGLTANTKYVLSATSGQMELLSDLTASENVVYVATAVSTTAITVQIEITGLTA